MPLQELASRPDAPQHALPESRTGSCAESRRGSRVESRGGSGFSVPMSARTPRTYSGASGRAALSPASGIWSGAQSLVIPPWGPERANLDQPPKEQVVQRQLDYQKLLDEQAAIKVEALRRKAEEDARADFERAQLQAQRAQSAASAEMDNFNAQMERAIFHELVATVAYKRSKDKERKRAESQDYARWKAESERQLAEQWHHQRQRARQDWADMASAWKQAVEEKRVRREEERSVVLRTEREAARRLMQGMAPPRRIRKFVEEPTCGQVIVHTQVQPTR